MTDRSDAPRADEPHLTPPLPQGSEADPTGRADAADQRSVGSSTPDGGTIGRSRGLGLLAGVVTACLVAAAVFGVWAWRSAADDDGVAIDHADHSAQGSDHSDQGSAGAHDGHIDGAVLEGCDADAMHASMMMFDPFVADGLLETGCPWPYSADVVIEGGAEDSSIAAAFEPRRYAEVFDLLTVDRLGMCSVARLPDPVVDGFVFGFRSQLHPGSCTDGLATVQLDIREYATRAWRDSAAHAAADSDAAVDVVVLGRWVIATSGDDSSAAAALAQSIASLDSAAVVSA